MTDKALIITISLPESLVKQIDEARGDVPRSRYLRKILLRTLKA
ncbi:MAG: hypothetical protein ABSF63_00135 [Candidatus Bathyarchaeia archaeon]